MPLVWAHAEYLKLCRSLLDGEIFDQPSQTVERYLVQQTTSDRIVWRFNNKVRAMPAEQDTPGRDACGRPSSIGASTGGAPCTTTRHGTRRLACT